MSFFDKFRANQDPGEAARDKSIADNAIAREKRVAQNAIDQMKQEAEQYAFKRFFEQFPDLYHKEEQLKKDTGYFITTTLQPEIVEFIKSSFLPKLEARENELTQLLNEPEKLTQKEKIYFEADLKELKSQTENCHRVIKWRTAQYEGYRHFVCHALLEQHQPQLKKINYDTTKLHQLIADNASIDDFETTLNHILESVTLEAIEPDPDFILSVRQYDRSTYEPSEGHQKHRAKDIWSYYLANDYDPSKISKRQEQELTWAILFERKHKRPPDKLEWENPDLHGAQVQQSQSHRDRHTYIIGKSGSGKTTLMLNMIYQDLKAGNGLGVIAPEQEMLTEQILPYIPEDRLEDVIYFNPADENPIPFNPLNLDPDEDADLKADEVMTIFKRIIGTEGTPRIDEILRQSIYALLTTPNTTILDIPKLLDRADPDYRHQIISQLQDEYCAHFWRDTYPQFPKDAHLPVLYRIGAFTRDKRIRNTLCRTGESLNFRQVMDTGKIILFNLSDGILGEQNSQLLGQLIVSQFQLAVASRANIPEQQRRRFYLYIDEFQTFTNTATSSYEKILSRARKYRLAIILAHQQTGQIPSELLRDIFGNVSTMISFTVSHKDATKFSKEFLTKQDSKLAPTPPEKFIELEVGETYCKLGRESFKMKTPLITEQPNWDIKEKILEHSRQQFTSDTPTPMATSQATPEPPSQPAPDEPLFTKPKIKPTGKIK